MLKATLLGTALRLTKPCRGMIAPKSAKAETLLFRNAISSEIQLANPRFLKSRQATLHCLRRSGKGSGNWEEDATK